MIKLVDECEECLEQLPPNTEQREDLMTSLHEIRTIVHSLSIHQHWPFMGGNFGKSELALLRMSARVLKDIIDEPILEAIALERLAKDLSEWRTRVGDAEISPELKASILKGVTRVIESMEDYRFEGAEGIRTATAEAVGRTVVDGSLRKVQPEERAFVAEYFKWLGRVADFIAVAQGANQLGEGIQKIIEALPNITK